MRHALHAAFHRPRTRIYAVVQTGIWILIVGSIGILLVEMVLPLGTAVRTWLARLDRVILATFAVELALRVGTYRPPSLDLFAASPAGRFKDHLLGRLRFLLRPLILIDLLTVIALVPALRGLRALRLLRLVRTTRIFRYANPFRGLERALSDNAVLFSFALTLLGLTVLLGGVTIALVEAAVNPAIDGVGDGMWWALVTLTTVGFGDINPVTTLGRVVGGTLMVAGLFNLALFAGIVGHTLLNAVLSIRQEQFRMSGYVDHVVVCGYDAGARMLLDALIQEFDARTTPLVVFAGGDRPEELPPEFQWVSGDPTKESELAKVRMSHARAALLVGSRGVRPQQADGTTILTAFTIRRYLANRDEGRRRVRPVYIVAEILDAENVDHARAAGADEVIETTRLGFSLLSHAAAMPGTAAVMGRVATRGAHSVFVGRPPPGTELPVAYGELVSRIKRETGALVIGLRDAGEGSETINPDDDHDVTPVVDLIYLAERPVLPAVGEADASSGRATSAASGEAS